MILIAFSLFASSCDFIARFKPKKNEDAVARVYDKYLLRSEVAAIVQPGTPSKDSLLLANNFIQNWIRQQVVLHKAETNLTAELKDVDKKLNEYRNSLITYAYEREIIRQNLDTSVSKKEIEQYYNDNKANFELHDNIVKAVYVKLKKNAPKVNQVRIWYRSDTKKDRRLLEEYCNQFASDFMQNDTTWHLFDEILKKMPVKPFDKETFLRTNSYLEAQDSTDLYLLSIKEYKIRQTQSPLSFVEDDIRVMIVNRKKLELIREMEKSIYEEAQKKNEFEIYTN